MLKLVPLYIVPGCVQEWGLSGMTSAPLWPGLQDVLLDPELCLLGNFTGIRDLWIMDKLNSWKLLYLRSGSVLEIWFPSPYQFLEISACIPLEKITHSVRKRYGTFLKVWQPYLDHMGASSVSSPWYDLECWLTVFLLLLFVEWGGVGRNSSLFFRLLFGVLLICSVFNYIQLKLKNIKKIL